MTCFYTCTILEYTEDASSCSRGILSYDFKQSKPWTLIGIHPTYKVVKFLTESPAGGLPLGFLVLSNHSQATLEAGLQDLKALLPDGAFGGRGREVGPKVIMTDDDTGEINALANTWPQATHLLCQWHILQVRQLTKKQMSL